MDLANEGHRALSFAIELEKLGMSALAEQIAVGTRDSIDKFRKTLDENHKVYLEPISPTRNESVVATINANAKFRKIVRAKAERNEAGVAEPIALQICRSDQKIGGVPLPQHSFGMLYTD